MSNLGYTFYPKDWWQSETFFKLEPKLRYVFLEIISMLYIEGGEWCATPEKVAQRFHILVSETDWEKLRKCFVIDGEMWQHTAVNKRLRRAIASRENGKLGGRPINLDNLEIKPRITHLSKVKEKVKVKEKIKEKVNKEKEEKEIKPKNGFTPPTREESLKFLNENSNTIKRDCKILVIESFHGYYEGNGWVQARGAKIKDWQATLRGWVVKEMKYNPNYFTSLPA